MDWQRMAPLTEQQTQSISDLQQLLSIAAPIAHGIDKSKIETLPRPELLTLPSNHPLRERYKQQMAPSKATNKDKEEREDDESKYSKKAPKFDYIQYFVEQMTAQRNTSLQLTQKLKKKYSHQTNVSLFFISTLRHQQSWNYLTQNANYMKTVLNSIENLQSVLAKLDEIYKCNQRECEQIHNECIDLIQEQQNLEKESNRLRKMVQYFADYNQIRARIFSPKQIDVLSNEFHKIVARINECIQFLTAHKEYKESYQYLTNYQLLSNKSIKMMKDFIEVRLIKAKKTSINDKNFENESAENNNLNILDFRAAASRIRPLIKLIENEAKRCDDYANLLNDVQKMVLNERKLSLKSLVDLTISEYSKSNDTPNLIRASCSYVMMICLREYKLFNEFFDLTLTLRKSLLSTTVTANNSKRPSLSKSSSPKAASKSPLAKYSYTRTLSKKQSPKSEENGGENDEESDDKIISGSKRISALIKDLCDLLYSYLRPFVIQTSSMQVLCDVIHILQAEIQQHLSSNYGKKEDLNSHIPDFDRIIVRIIEDAQERLVFRTQIHLRDSVQNYEITDDDLAYYQLLKKLNEPNATKETETEQNEDEHEQKSAEITRYGDWSPILEKTLSVLSKVYPVLNHSVFEFLAYEAVSCCVTSLVNLARKLAQKTSSVHGHLFLIKHLLILREQISPFDVDFSITATTLNFGHMTSYLGNLVSSSKGYSLVEVFQHTIPAVNKQQLNSKKSMESVLKKACEAFIETQTNLLIGPLIALISAYKQQCAINNLRKQHRELNEEKIHPLKKVNEKKTENEKVEIKAEKEESVSVSVGNSADDKFKEQLKATLISCEQGLIVRINELMEMMKLYLSNDLTQRILIKPILSNIQSAFIQLRKIVVETKLDSKVKLDVCDKISDELQAIVDKTSR